MKVGYIYLLILCIVAKVSSINSQVFEKGTFKYDVSTLQKGVKDILILRSANSSIAVSPEYQGRVFITSSKGDNGKTRGWINWELLESGKHVDSFSHLGGESRLWLGPEFGKFSVYFDPNKKFETANMRAPKDLDSKKFKIISQNDYSVTSAGNLSIINAQGYTFECLVNRKIAILNQKDINTNLNIKLPSTVDYVGFSAETTLENNGSKKWDKTQGLLSIWELGCMLTSPNTTAFMPIRNDDSLIKSYFSKSIDTDKLLIENNVVYYKANAENISKIGIPPKQTINKMGSYSPELNLLSIVTFTFKDKELYVNSIPGNKEPYKGDVINIFNGEVNEQKKFNWPFFEFESSSAAKELKVGESIQHEQTIYHFEGTIDELNKISKAVLNVDLSALPL